MKARKRHLLNLRSLGLALALSAGVLLLLIKVFIPCFKDSEKTGHTSPVGIKRGPGAFGPPVVEKATDDGTTGVVGPARTSVGKEAGSSRHVAERLFQSSRSPKPLKREPVEVLVNDIQGVFARDLSEKEKIEAIRTLEDIDDPFVVEAVMIALADEESEVRKAALDVLKGVDHWAVNDALLLGMNDDEVEVTEKAIAVMDELSSPNVLPGLEKALMDSDQKTQIRALEILEDIDDPEVVEILIERGLLSDNDDVFEATLDSLEYITSLRFETYEQARTWWDVNRNTVFKFD